MDTYAAACQLLPGALRTRLEGFQGERAEEIRLRVAHRPAVIIGGRENELPGSAIKQAELEMILEKATGASLHSSAFSIAQGYFSYKGIRIGICGEAVVSGGDILGFRSFGSLSLRIPHQCPGVCDEIAPILFSNGAESVLVISPPGGGKTTALRELARICADRGWRTGIVDERNEISASENGIPAFSLGRCCDVLINVPKAKGAMMLVRSMNPELVAMDEITRADDIEVIRDLNGCGVKVLATAHAKSLEDMLNRPSYKALLSEGLFKWLVQIKLNGGRREYSAESLS